MYIVFTEADGCEFDVFPGFFQYVYFLVPRIFIFLEFSAIS